MNATVIPIIVGALGTFCNASGKNWKLKIEGGIKTDIDYIFPNFGLVENFRRLYLMVLVITSSEYPFFNKVFFQKSSSSASLGLEQIIEARRTKGFY